MASAKIKMQEVQEVVVRNDSALGWAHEGHEVGLADAQKLGFELELHAANT